MRSNSDRRIVIAVAATLVALVGAGCGGGTSASSEANVYNTIKPGVVTAAIEWYMPYTASNKGSR